ncbi:hypothetical protein [Thalassotalea agarivorans]|uniref:DUF3149 domain-containing protein n=1 Tax=Thalassotalea agarivorans TaxID=349064 RepID=A0A1I0CV67_THASX|nr:hypothetical protein [Thalassotalea agarivorans]SET23526.1 hypothetical protein SAMN05660429_01337 [Thalassotalea agarivorans]
MDIFTMFFNDPVVFISFTGLAVVLAICAYYVWFFLSHIEHDSKGSH